MVDVYTPTSIRLDPKIKSWLESTYPLHKTTLSDLTREATLKFLSQYVPSSVIEERIECLRKELQDLETARTQAKIAEDELKRTLAEKPSIHGNTEVFKTKREDLFKTGPGTLMNQLARNQKPAWDNVFLKYGFSTPKEMELWVRQEALSRGILS